MKAMLLQLLGNIDFRYKMSKIICGWAFCRHEADRGPLCLPPLTFWCDAKTIFSDQPKVYRKLLKVGSLCSRVSPTMIDGRVPAIWPPQPGTIIKETGKLTSPMRDLPRQWGDSLANFY